MPKNYFLKNSRNEMGKYSALIGIMFVLALAVTVFSVGLKPKVTQAANGNPYSCSTSPSPHPTVQKGNSNSCVKHLQWYLNHPGTGTGYGLVEDGIFGTKTDSAVRNFQYKQGLAVDGIVGPKTWSALHVWTTPPKPTVSLKANGASGTVNVYLYNSLKLSWTTGNKPASCTASGSWSGGKAAGGGTEDRSSDARSVKTLTYSLTCSNFGGSTTSTVTVNVIKSGAPSAPSNLKVTGVTSNSVGLSWTGSTPAPGSSIKCYSVRDSGGNQKVCTTNTNYVVSSLPACTDHAYYVVAINNQGTPSSASNKVTAKTTGCSAPAPAPTPSPAPAGSGGGTKPAPGTTGTAPVKPVADAQVQSKKPDTEAPSAPQMFTAKITNGLVSLEWQSASDGGGVSHYQLDRSTDQQTWDSLAGGITKTDYIDQNTSYDTRFFYRLRAVDTSGNTGPYALTEVKTPVFVSNLLTEGETTLTSDDELITVIIPFGAVEGDARCYLAPSENEIKIAKAESLSGPYLLTCKKPSGDVVERFGAPVTLKFAIDDQRRSDYKKVLFYTRESAWIKVPSAYDKEAGVDFYATDKPLEFAIMGQQKEPLPWTVIVLGIAALGTFAGVMAVRLRQLKRMQYEEYMRRKYYEL